jgi:hypothetical protein
VTCRLLRMRAAAVVLAAAAAGCASEVGPAGMLVLPDKYRLSTCEQIATARRGQEARERELVALSEKASSAPGGAVASLLAYASELAAARSELRVLAVAAKDNKCVMPPMELAR